MYLLLTRVLCHVSPVPLKAGIQELRDELRALGSWSATEKRVAWVFGWTAAMWVGRRWLVEGLRWPLDDTTIAMAAGVLLFVIPSGEAPRKPLLSWEDTRRLPWDILLLFGGGLTLAGQLADAGVLASVATALASIPALSPAWLILGFVLLSLFLTCLLYTSPSPRD